MISPAQSSSSVSGPADVLAALHQASATTGSDFNYLLGTAMRESSLQTQVTSKNSSATGLFQFVDQTWLGLVKRFGDDHGLGPYAAAIQKSPGGRYTVDSADMKAAILALRKDAKTAALMAGEAARETKDNMRDSLGRDVSCGELYAAHFLGEGSACRLIALKEADPDQRADLAFPQAAKANHNVFYHADGSAKTAGEVYAWAANLPDANGGAKGAPSGTATRAVKSSPAAAPDFDADQFAFVANPQMRSEYSDRLRRDVSNVTNAHSVRHRTASLSPEGAGSVAATSLPHTPLVLTPGVMEILASLDSGGGSVSLRRSL